VPAPTLNLPLLKLTSRALPAELTAMARAQAVDSPASSGRHWSLSGTSPRDSQEYISSCLNDRSALRSYLLSQQNGRKLHARAVRAPLPFWYGHSILDLLSPLPVLTISRPPPPSLVDMEEQYRQLCVLP